MAVETDTETEFGEVSRLRGAIFEYVSLGASVVGLLALAALLIYVFVDAFGLATASPAWLLTYFLTLVVPYIGFCLYSVGDRAFTRKVALALGGGLVVTAVGFTAIETLVGTIPRLTWQLAYLFLVATPTVASVTFVASREPVGTVGFGLIGRLIGGAALGCAVAVMFIVIDRPLWFLVYTLGVLPAVGVAAYGRRTDFEWTAVAAGVIGLVGFVVATVLRPVVGIYPSDGLIYLWTLGIPLAVGAAGIVWLREASRKRVAAVGGSTLLAAAAGILLGSSALPNGSGVIVTGATVAAIGVYLTEAVDADAGRQGLLLPVLLAVGALAGAAVVQLVGITTPEMWLTPEYVTSAPSNTAAEAGLYPAIVGSIIIIGIVAVLSFVLGVGAAVFLEEYAAGTGLVGRITRLFQINIANLAAVPSVVYGLLGLGLFANLLGFGFGTAVTIALTLSLLILPITVISAQEALRSVPDELRQGSYAMGATRWQTIKNVVLPEAMPGMLTGTILALGRAIGETAPLIMVGAATTVFSAPSGIWSRFSAMPMQIYAWANFPQEEFRYGVVAAGVVTLLIVLLAMNGTAIIIRNRMEREH
ncbi:phosphate ABC transporter permease PstA [Halonotius terrestris]|uniref:Phosphate transport system permease protein PstA n=1 Tax=Halonotius terrestris TaxID=2487750 RepID=A0A8J8TC50_9EURY|nr:phosphate ABC transporter permease PstA [Halonotius terrestris]TQQ82817.1 phosphate ABC transporter permease PstA [Halonotius terrestris]